MAQGTFNADTRASELVPTEVQVGDNTYKVKRSGRALKAIIAMSPKTDVESDPVENISLLYRGIAELLVHEDGTHPDPDMLEDNLDFEVAQELMEKFVPARAEGNAAEPASATAPSTDTSTPEPAPLTTEG